MKKKKQPERVPKQIDNLYERLVAVLGQSPDSSIYSDLLTDMGNPPFEDQIFDKNPMFGPEQLSYLRHYYHSFPELGFDIRIQEELVHTIHLRLFRFKRDPSWFRTFEGRLPAGIDPSDGNLDVRRKLTVPPIKSDVVSQSRTGPGESRDIYELDGIRIVIYFDPCVSSVFLSRAKTKQKNE